MAQGPLQRAICALCELEKPIYARKACWACYYVARDNAMLDEWLPMRGKSVPKPIRRINSRTGTSGNRNAERVYQTTAAVHAHVITIETEGPMHYAVCSCRRFTSSRWTIEHRAALAGAAHQYAMSFPVVPALPDTTAPFQEAPVVFPHGSCYIHVDEQPCACLAGCVMCTGCLCSCDCLSRT